MPRRMVFRSLVSVALSLTASACEREVKDDGAPVGPDAGVVADSPAESEPADAAGEAPGSNAPVELTAVDVEAFERGFAKEIELVRQAQARGREATTAEERGRAAQEEWAEQTAPGGAQAAGLSAERYWEIRETVTEALQTLDFQGEIEGPMEMDLERASPEMRRRLEGDAFAALSPGSAAALRARLDRLATLWSEYVGLTAVAG